MVIGKNCIIGKDVYIDFDVKIGDNVKIQNSALIYHGATIEDGVFIGPQVCLTNDRMPRAITSDGQLKGNDDWVVGPILVKYGASIGAGSLILPNVTIGRFSLVGAGAVVYPECARSWTCCRVIRLGLLDMSVIVAEKWNKKVMFGIARVCDWTFEPTGG